MTADHPNAAHLSSSPGKRRFARRPSPLIVGTLGGVAALVLFSLTAARGVEWQDPGFHQYRIVTGQIEHPCGLALAHPLHYWLGRAVLHVPFGEPLQRLNLMSSVCGAVGVGCLAALLALLTRSAAAALLAALTLMLAHTYWQMSALTETYTLAAALMTIEWLLLYRFMRTGRAGWLAAVFFVNGLHIADHLLGLLTLATYGVLLLVCLARGRVRLVWLPVCGALWMIGASPYLALILEQYQQSHDAVATLRSALFGGGGQLRGWQANVLNARLSGAQLLMVGLTYGYCFPSLALLVALGGILRRTRGRRRAFLWLLTAQTVIVCLFVFRYSIKDVYTYFVPVCVLTALWFGVGVAAWRRALRRAMSRRVLVGLLAIQALLPLAVYIYFPIFAESRGLMKKQMRVLPFRNPYAQFFHPWRMTDDSSERCAAAALAEAGDGGWIIADSTPGPMIAAYAAVHGPPADTHVYWSLTRQCLYPLGEPPLNDVAMIRHLRGGGRVIAIESREVEALVPPAARIEKSSPFWRIFAANPTTEP